jgi:uncharacterized protein YjbI with pentapeptide repeats
MANPEHLQILKQGVEEWRQWLQNRGFREADLREADLRGAALRGVDLGKVDLGGAYLRGADLREADLREADLHWADLHWADLGGADLRGTNLYGACLLEADLRGADLRGADLFKADLREADLFKADLRLADLREADLRGAQLLGANLAGASLGKADLSRSVLIETNLEEANLTGCRVYGISAWDVHLRGAQQSDLVITAEGEPVITVDNLEVAQFIYLLFHNEKIREVIDTITSKAVLILGRFTPERKAVLDAIREELRHRNYVPILFDFDKPGNKDVTGTVETLARMARFIIADLTDPSSIPHELATIVPFLRTTPVLPLRLVGSGGYSMFDDLQRAYRWVLGTHEYQASASLIASLSEVIAPADAMAEELRK